MNNIIKNIKSEELIIHLLEERIKIINSEIERIDQILDQYGNYKIKKVKTLTNKFNSLLNTLSCMKKELRERKLYHLGLKESICIINA